MVDVVAIIAGFVIIAGLLLFIAVGITLIATSIATIARRANKEWDAIIRRDINDESS
jgi:hypothetical protein